MFFGKQDKDVMDPGSKGEKRKLERAPEYEPGHEHAPEPGHEHDQKHDQEYDQEPEWKRQQSQYFSAKVEALQGKARRYYLSSDWQGTCSGALAPGEERFRENKSTKKSEQFTTPWPGRPASRGIPGRIAGWGAVTFLALLVPVVVLAASRWIVAGVSRPPAGRADEIIFWYQAEPEVAVVITKILNESNGVLPQPVRPVPVPALGQLLAASIQDSREDKAGSGAGKSPDLVLLDPFSATYFFSHQAFLPLESFLKRDHLEDPTLFTPLPLIAGRYVLAIPRTARKPNAAWDLMKYLVTHLPQQITPLLD